MCGFAGVIAWDEKFRTSHETLAEMSARIAHRGPDGEGTYFSSDGPITPMRPHVALAHRRLAILDPDPRANQPFTGNAGRWLVFNGEIYNFRELRAELARLQPDYAWRTQCDTEVLLLAYDQWGEKCVEHFNGMFALAIWDEPSKAVFLARDRMGQKPLYFACVKADGTILDDYDFRHPSSPPAAVAFASELGALSPLSWIDRALNEVSLTDYLLAGYISGGTIHRGVQELNPAQTLTIQSIAGTFFKRSRYFTIDDAPPADDRDAVTGTRTLLIQAVKRQLVSDVPIGCFLSGGVDSSVICAAVRQADANIDSFSLGFDDPRHDERPYAREVARHLGSKHHEFCIQPNAAEDLPKLAACFGQPFADSSALPTHYLSRQTRGAVKVALSGDGGDELFAGYDRYRAMRLARKLEQIPRPLLSAISRASQHLPGVDPKGRLARFKRFALQLGTPPHVRYMRYISIFSPQAIAEVLLPDCQRSAGRALREVEGGLWEYFKDGDPVRGAMRFDRQSYLPGDLLTKVDRASMLHALEVRSPFMDHELVQFAAGLTTDQLLAGGPKRMLREAFADDLPGWVFKRRKMGFAVPIGDWFRGELRPMLRDHLFAANSFATAHFNRPVVERFVEEHEMRRDDHSQRLYALLMLELWWRGSGKC